VEGGGNSLKNNNLNTYFQDLDDLGVAEIEEIIETPENTKYLASLGLSSNLSEPYPYDVTTVLAYKEFEGYNYVFDKLVYVENDDEFMLTGGQNYTLLLYGGRVDESNIYNKENFVKVYIENKNLNFKPLFQRIYDFIPNGNKTTNVLPVKMRYPGSHVTLVFDTTDILGGNIGKKITLISSEGHNNDDIALRGYRQNIAWRWDFSFLYGDGVITKERVLEFKGDSKLSAPIVLGNTLRKDIDITLSFKTEDMPKRTIKIPLSYKQTFKIKIGKCGAYLWDDVRYWHQFMCHNLGADYNLDPFVPSENIHGDKYQWGYKDPIIKQKDDVYESGPVSGWNTVRKYDTWDNGIDDPCPSGYRVPIGREWDKVLRYNNINRIGTWNGNLGRNANAGIKFGDNLMLPAAGARDEYGTTNHDYSEREDVGTLVIYWSSTPYSVLNAQQRGNTTKRRAYSSAMPVRCIKRHNRSMH